MRLIDRKQGANRKRISVPNFQLKEEREHLNQGALGQVNFYGQLIDQRPFDSISGFGIRDYRPVSLKNTQSIYSSYYQNPKENSEYNAIRFLNEGSSQGFSESQQPKSYSQLCKQIIEAQKAQIDSDFLKTKGLAATGSLKEVTKREVEPGSIRKAGWPFSSSGENVPATSTKVYTQSVNRGQIRFGVTSSIHDPSLQNFNRDWSRFSNVEDSRIDIGKKPGQLNDAVIEAPTQILSDRKEYGIIRHLGVDSGRKTFSILSNTSQLEEWPGSFKASQLENEKSSSGKKQRTSFRSTFSSKVSETEVQPEVLAGNTQLRTEQWDEYKRKASNSDISEFRKIELLRNQTKNGVTVSKTAVFKDRDRVTSIKDQPKYLELKNPRKRTSLIDTFESFDKIPNEPFSHQITVNGWSSLKVDAFEKKTPTVSEIGPVFRENKSNHFKDEKIRKNLYINTTTNKSNRTIEQATNVNPPYSFRSHFLFPGVNSSFRQGDDKKKSTKRISLC